MQPAVRARNGFIHGYSDANAANLNCPDVIMRKKSNAGGKRGCRITACSPAAYYFPRTDFETKPKEKVYGTRQVFDCPIRG